jgi:uncharacterized YccA/Bax inhibitor family protein
LPRLDNICTRFPPLAKIPGVVTVARMTGNPTLSDKTFSRVPAVGSGGTMTIDGTVNKTAILLVLTVLSASYTWRQYFTGNGAAAGPLMAVGAFGGFIVAMVTCFKSQWAMITAPLYAILEGLFIGGISALYERQMHGIAIQAVMLTFGTLAGLLGLYKLGVIKATDGFRRGVFAATGGIALFYLVAMILSLFSVQIPLIYGSGPFGILFSVVVVVVAAMNLVIDFDFIERGARGGAPRYMEWYAAFSLMVTLVWLYLEILRLLAKLNRRN